MLKYVSGSDGSSILLTSQSVKSRIKKAGFYDFNWDVEETKKTIGSVVNGFGKTAVQYELVIDFIGDKSERAKNADLFYETTEKDVLYKTTGRLYFDDYYLECFVIGSESGGRDGRNRMVQKKARIYAPHPFWVKENLISVPAETEPAVLGLMYDYTYNYAYGENGLSLSFINDHFTECDFRLTAMGPFDSLYFSINSNVYEVEISALEGEQVILDTKKESITKIDLYGNCWNVFGDQNFSYDNFAKIPGGENVLSYSRNHALELVLYQERSEPKWGRSTDSSTSEENITEVGIATEDEMYLITEDNNYLQME